MALYKTKNGKNPGADTITNEMLKHTSSKAKCALLTLFNKSWHAGICPKELKFGEIVTIPKPGKDPADTESFRLHNFQTNGKSGPRQIPIFSRKRGQTISQPGRLQEREVVYRTGIKTNTDHLCWISDQAQWQYTLPGHVR